MQSDESKITLRPMTAEDTDNIVLWRNRDFVRKNFIDQRLFTPESHMEWYRTRVLTGQVVQFIIEVNAIPVGSVYLRDINRSELMAEYGIFIGVEEYCGHGIGTKVCGMMSDFAKTELKLKKLFLKVRSENALARNSYENNGFIPVREENGIIYMEREL